MTDDSTIKDSVRMKPFITSPAATELRWRGARVREYFHNDPAYGMYVWSRCYAISPAEGAVRGNCWSKKKTGRCCGNPTVTVLGGPTYSYISDVESGSREDRERKRAPQGHALAASITGIMAEKKEKRVVSKTLCFTFIAAENSRRDDQHESDELLVRICTRCNSMASLSKGALVDPEEP